MKYLSFSLKSIFFIALTAAFMYACKKEFDVPPGPKDPDLKATHTIAQLKGLHKNPGDYDVVNDSIIISGVVIANDKSGNLYKQIYIQDTTGAIQLMLDGSGLYNSYPVGRKLFIKCKGLCVSDYNRMIQLGVKTSLAGTPSIQPIASNLIGQYIIGGSLNNPVTAKKVRVDTLKTTMQTQLLGTLIELQDYEFVVQDTSKTYSDTSAYKESLNLTVKGCSGGSDIIIRTSGYANFSGVPVPNGNGTIVALYTVFNSTKQLVLRDTSDVKLNGFRCGTGPTTVMNISDLRALFTGTATSAPSGRRVSGIVISDRSKNNLNARNLVLQQGNGLSGIAVRFDANHSFNLGDSIDVVVSGVELSEFNGLLQVNNVPLANASLRSTGKSITPRVATIADINTNFETWESTLVRINNVSLSGGTTPGKYSGNVTLSASGTIVMFTSSTATFAGQNFPTNASSITGYLNQFTAKQIAIRDPAIDVVP
jgi:hypothetical protein